MTKYEAEDIQKLRDSGDPKKTFELLPPDYRTEAVSLIAVSLDPTALEYVPKEFCTYEVVKKALEETPYAASYIRSECFTQDISKLAARTFPDCLIDMPDEFKTEQMCLEPLYYSDEWEDDDTMVLSGINYSKAAQTLFLNYQEKGKYYNPECFKYIREECLTEEFIGQVWGNDKELFPYIPNHYKTAAMCLEAVLYKGEFLEFVPYDKREENLCLIAARNNHFAIKYFPYEFLTEKYVLGLFEKNETVLEVLPENLISREVCEKIVEKGNLELAKYISDSATALKLLLNARNWNYNCLTELFNPHIIDVSLAYSILIKASNDRVETEYLALPKHVRNTEAISWFAATKSIKVLKYIPDKYKTDEFCIALLERDPCAVAGLPLRLQKPEVYKGLVEKDGMRICYVPDHFKTKELCVLAMENTDYKNCSEHACIFGAIPYEDLRLKAVEQANNDLIVASIMTAIPEDEHTPKLVKAACRKSPLTFKHVNNGFLDSEDFVHIVKWASYLFSKIPVGERSAEMCVHAVLFNSNNEKEVPSIIKERDNIYTFYKELQKSSSTPIISFHTIKEKYEQRQNEIAFTERENRTTSNIRKKTPQIKNRRM